MLVKVYRGTGPQNAESLCETCRHSRIVRGRRIDEELVVCNAVMLRPVHITFKVTSCSDYLDAREPYYCELVEKAWILRPAKKGRPAGFVRAVDLKGREAERLFDDPMGDD
jgi:hypothetical protein